MWNNFYRGWKCLWLLLLLCFASSLSEAAELKKEVIEELASDLAAINRVLTSTQDVVAMPWSEIFPALEKGIIRAGAIDKTMFVAGKVTDLKKEFRAVITPKSVKPYKYVGTWAAAFKPAAKVTFTGFAPVGKIRTVSDLEGNLVPWTSARIVRTVSLPMESRIRDAISRLEQLKNKYAGQGLIVKGFSLSLPVLSLSVNFEFE